MSKFAELDLHPDIVSNLEMGYLYEALVRRFSEFSNDTAGEHFTPRYPVYDTKGERQVFWQRTQVSTVAIDDADELDKIIARRWAAG